MYSIMYLPKSKDKIAKNKCEDWNNTENISTNKLIRHTECWNKKKATK